MAQRNKLPIELIWVLVDLGLPQVNALLNVAANRHKGKVPGAELSVNTSADGTQALVKIAEGETGFRNALSGAAKNAIIAIFNEATHHEALALVRAPGWEPEEEE
jgi:hypothetical protein